MYKFIKTQPLIIAGLLFSTNLIAATDTVLVTGTITEVVTVNITPNNNSFTITAGTAVSDQDIATIAINANAPLGYDVTMAGTNLTSILENAANDETMAYTVKYQGGSAIGLTSSPVNVENVATQTTGSENRTFTLSIAAGESVGKSAEAFTDTVTVQIVGK